MTLTHALWPRSDPTFPTQLAEINSPPKQLYALGDRETLSAPCVAIVGTRHPTPYGTHIATQLAERLADAGACVISGMAAGIDGVVHRAALSVKGRTVAVLGPGIDHPYPRAHTSLYRAIAADGLVISEFGPGITPFPGCFPRRNRIIAGLASVVIIVEAGSRSGALITANYAAEFGRTVAAVPGPIDSEQSKGTNQLLRDGANVIADIDDALMLVGLTGTNPDKSNGSTAANLDGDQAIVWNAITPGRDMDGIIKATGLSASRCSIAVTMLEMQGLIRCLLNGELQKRG